MNRSVPLNSGAKHLRLLQNASDRKTFFFPPRMSLIVLTLIYELDINLHLYNTFWVYLTPKSALEHLSHSPIYTCLEA